MSAKNTETKFTHPNLVTRRAGAEFPIYGVVVRSVDPSRGWVAVQVSNGSTLINQQFKSWKAACEWLESEGFERD